MGAAMTAITITNQTKPVGLATTTGLSIFFCDNGNPKFTAQRATRLSPQEQQ
jgi:hypothetical protein